MSKKIEANWATNGQSGNTFTMPDPTQETPRDNDNGNNHAPLAWLRNKEQAQLIGELCAVAEKRRLGNVR